MSLAAQRDPLISFSARRVLRALKDRGDRVQPEVAGNQVAEWLQLCHTIIHEAASQARDTETLPKAPSGVVTNALRLMRSLIIDNETTGGPDMLDSRRSGRATGRAPGEQVIKGVTTCTSLLQSLSTCLFPEPAASSAAPIADPACCEAYTALIYTLLQSIASVAQENDDSFKLVQSVSAHLLQSSGLFSLVFEFECQQQLGVLELMVFLVTIANAAPATEAAWTVALCHRILTILLQDAAVGVFEAIVSVCGRIGHGTNQPNAGDADVSAGLHFTEHIRADLVSPTIKLLSTIAVSCLSAAESTSLFSTFAGDVDQYGRTDDAEEPEGAHWICLQALGAARDQLKACNTSSAAGRSHTSGLDSEAIPALHAIRALSHSLYHACLSSQTEPTKRAVLHIFRERDDDLAGMLLTGLELFVLIEPHIAPSKTADPISAALLGELCPDACFAGLVDMIAGDHLVSETN